MSRLYARINSDRSKTQRTAQGNYNMDATLEDWGRRATMIVAPNSHGENVVSFEAGAKNGHTHPLVRVNLTTGEVEISPIFDHSVQHIRDVV
jgi:hypothetical protein